LYRAGRYREAATLARDLTRRDPAQPSAWNVLTASLKALGRVEEAIAAAESAVGALPAQPDLQINLGLLLAEAGRLEAAAEVLHRCARDHPDQTDARLILGRVALADGHGDRAAESFGAVLARQPERADAKAGLGRARHLQGRPREAVGLLRAALRHTPNETTTRSHLADALEADGDSGAAEAVRREVADRMPDSAAAHNNHGKSLVALSRLNDAEAAFLKALELNPDLAETRTNLGNVYRAQGRREAAEASYRRALDVNPASGEAYRGLAAVKRFHADDGDLAAIEGLLSRPAGVPARDRIALAYAAGKARADIGDDPAAAFARFAEGAGLKRAGLSYDVKRDEALAAAIADAFPADRIAALHAVGGGDPSPAPIFIVGMPRSGSTLVEQILASHAEVAAGGERTGLRAAVVAESETRGAPFPDWVADLDKSALERLGARYRDSLPEPHGAGGPMTDKMPANFRFLGLIHACLPRAQIVHVHRDPLDTCLSCFTHLFGGSDIPYSYDLRELGRYYAAYARLMAHWRAVLAPHALLDLRYEDLVANLPGQTARLLTHCGLPWDDTCLAFHETARDVRTASAEQVRRPLSAASIGRWKTYAEQLAPLRAVLAGAGVIGE
jgi:tetratricopeptide (TPR) repeat protein